MKKDFLAYIEPATETSPEKKLPVALYQGVWHTLKYTSGLNEKLVYISEPIPEVHDYDVEVPTCNSESEPEQDPLNITIRNSPTILKEPLAPTTPVTQTPFFAIAKSDLSQSITGDTNLFAFLDRRKRPAPGRSSLYDLDRGKSRTGLL